MEFDEEQIKIIELGKDSGVDVSIFARPEYDARQMEQIFLGLERNTDISLFADCKFTSAQMYEIRSGIEDGVKASLYARKDFSEDDMFRFRCLLKDGKDITPFLDKGFTSGQIKEILDEEHLSRFSKKAVISYFKERKLEHDISGILNKIEKTGKAVVKSLSEKEMVAYAKYIRKNKDFGISVSPKKRYTINDLGEKIAENFYNVVIDRNSRAVAFER